MSEQTILPVRFTPTELLLLDWLMTKLKTSSRGATLRAVLYAMGRYHGGNCELIFRAHQERAAIRTRRGPLLSDPLPEGVPLENVAGPTCPEKES